MQPSERNTLVRTTASCSEILLKQYSLLKAHIIRSLFMLSVLKRGQRHSVSKQGQFWIVFPINDPREPHNGSAY